MADASNSRRSPWFWVPTLYTAQGLPYAMAMYVSVALYKNLGLSNGEIAYYTGWLYLPWVLKPIWSPLVDILKTRRQWIWATQFLLGAALAAIAMTIPAPHFLQLTLAFFWLLAFNSATHDIAVDGFYMLATTEREQSCFSGVRNFFYRVAIILAQGELVSLVGKMRDRYGGFVPAWSLAFAVLAAILLAFGLYHLWILPRPAADTPGRIATAENFFAEFFKTFLTFFRKPRIAAMLSFLLLYRLGEAQLDKMIQPFLLDPRSQGGLGLTDGQLGLIYGTLGIAALMLGGLLGGFVVGRQGLRFWLWPMLLAIHLPDAAFLWLAWAQPANLWSIGAAVALEQFGYGFGFTAFMLYMIYIARGEHRTAHYAICTGFMALGMMLPAMWSGRLQEYLGYPRFFVCVLLATIPSFIAALLIPLDSGFGKRTD